ncbi:MAG: DNA polymerase/3'-5' exonuclease PolX [Candidatus Lokiarchaeota archaeon]
MSQLKNNKIADMLYEIADLLELKGIQFKPQAYRRAARNIKSLPESIESLYVEGELKEIPGVGESIALKIKEILETGKLQYLDDLKEEFPKHLQNLLKIQGLGPKRLMKLYKELDIKNLEDLEKALKNEEIQKIEGFGKKSEENILKGIQLYKESQKRFLLGDILPIALELKNMLIKQEVTEKVEVAGSIRRRKETIGDVDILVVSDNPSQIMDFFVNLEMVNRVLSKGLTRSSVITKNNLQIDLRVIERSSFGSALLYFTGSKEHNIKLRKIALERNWKLSEYGLRDKDKNVVIAQEKEDQIYKVLNMEYIPPELREDRGEIEAAIENKLPKLIELSDIRGDLHIHTKWSVGENSIEEMAHKGIVLGYQYIAICDHTKGLQVANGLDENRFTEQFKEIDKLNEKLDEIEILKGAEVNIDSNGKLDMNNSILKELDVVIASIHSGFKSTNQMLTDRLISAMHNDYVNIIGHPTGRIIHHREALDLDLTKIFNMASVLGIYMELNSYPNRLDLSDINCKKAKNSDLKIVINTDAHNKTHMNYMELGVVTAKRGWIEKPDVLN